MSDKPLIQQHLAEELAQMLIALEDKALLYLKAFWKTIIREWYNIDRLRWMHSCRLDKYYMLLRKFHYYTFKWLAGRDFQDLPELLSLLTHGPLRYLI